MKVSKILLFAVLVVIAVLACQVALDTAGKSCATDPDCGADRRCEDGVCVREDTSSCGSCGVGFGCRDGECLAECAVDANCAVPALCVDGLCEERSDIECTDGTRCDSPPTSYEQCFDAGCDGGACTYTVLPVVVCQAAGCENGAVYTERLCGSDGSCPDTGTTSCDGYACDAAGVACLTVCGNNDGCDTGFRCDSSNDCVALVADGQACGPDGTASCASGYCDGTLCCTSGDCCSVPGDCPPSYSSAATCTDTSDATDCQGTGIGPVCNNHVCATEIIEDDRPCAGLEHACADNFAPVTCLDQEEQSDPICATECSTIEDCAAGYQCDAPNCVPIGNQGSACTGTGQGTCDSGLKCENNICCLESGPTCCADDDDCADGLACNDSVLYSCYDSCNDYDTSRCADPVNNYCLSDVCVSKIARGQSCTYGAECLDNFCVEQVCCSGACDDQCESCLETLTGESDGTCVPILLNGTDVEPVAVTCSGGTGCTGTDCVCDGNLGCFRANNAACTDSAECAGGACECFDSQCADMRCRETFCPVCVPALTVTSCGGDLGLPGPIEDPNPVDSCDTDVACFGGDCLKKDGTGCGANSECGNICFNGTCQAPRALLQTCDAGEDEDCAGAFVCSSGTCKIPDGESCSDDGECVNGTCAGDVCCSGPCTGPCADCSTGTCIMPADDSACTVDCDGLDTTCRDYDDVTSGRCLAVGQCKPSNNSTYCTSYSNSGGSTSCGTCRQCDGSGNCNVTPADDTACPVIDCSGSNTACRTYHNITSGRCEGFGDCKEVADCSSFTPASSGADCGICRRCDDSGNCNVTPADDTRCTINCDPLDVVCRDYHTPTSRCEGFGDCKESPEDCTYTNASSSIRCGTCQICTAGSCSTTSFPTDDPACVVDCDLADTTCRNYHDLTSGRCEGVNDCKDSAISPSNVRDCVGSYSNTPASPITECGACQSCNGSGSCVGYCEAGDTCEVNIFTLDDCRFVALNQHNESCDNVCESQDAWCADVGIDSAATNGAYYHYQASPSACLPYAATCTTWLGADLNYTCGGHEAQWTNCLCERN